MTYSVTEVMKSTNSLLCLINHLSINKIKTPRIYFSLVNNQINTIKNNKINSVI